MSKYLQLLFLGVAGWESALILWDCGGPQVNIEDTEWTLEQVRILFVVASIFCFSLLNLFKSVTNEG